MTKDGPEIGSDVENAQATVPGGGGGGSQA